MFRLSASPGGGRNVDHVRERVRASLEVSEAVLVPSAFEKLSRLLRYVEGDYQKEGTFTRQREILGKAQINLMRGMDGHNKYGIA